ncbi:MAG TPA: response regulator [Gemmataceae bacterium]|nr:response regulator [Gemmataceae bacterium]
MSEAAGATETILIVDDEESVRQTFREWLERGAIGCRILTAADAEAALTVANHQTIDLAILDWNLGAGNDGLQLLEDLYLFNPNVVAIMVTGFAHQATPLDAMRMGVRDYLDKNQDLDRDSFLRAVNRQLERIRPAKRERRLHEGLVAFREAVEMVLPLVRSAAALNDPVPLPVAIGSLFRFLVRTTGARDGVLLVRHYDAARQPPESCRAYTADGKSLEVDLAPFAHSLAGTVASLQEPYATERLDQAASSGSVELQPFERGRTSLLAAPLAVAPGVQVVLELFDKQSPTEPAFTAADRALAAAAAEFGAEMLRQALGEQQTHRLLLDAIGAALRASDRVAETLRSAVAERRDEPPAAVMEKLREGLRSTTGPDLDADESLRLMEAVRELAGRHGPPAVRHCTRLVQGVRDLLDSVAGVSEKEEGRPRARGPSQPSDAGEASRE